MIWHFYSSAWSLLPWWQQSCLRSLPFFWWQNICHLMSFQAAGLNVAVDLFYSPSQPAWDKFNSGGTKESPDSIQGNNKGPDHGDRLRRRRLFISVIPTVVDEALYVLQGKFSRTLTIFLTRAAKNWMQSDVSYRWGRTQSSIVVAIMKGSTESQYNDEEHGITVRLQARVKNRGRTQ